MIRSTVLLSLIFILFFLGTGQATTYAVVGTGGNATQDDIFGNSEWWTDLYCAYEVLLNQGFRHNRITVLYGEGHDYVSGYDRFRNRWQNEISEITDYNNHRATIQHVLDSLSHVITAADTLLFWWVIGHGNGTTMSNYTFFIENENVDVTEADFTTWVNGITNYSFRMFIWATCHSGGIRDNLANNKTIVITACEYNENHHPMYYGQAPFQNTVTAVFPNLSRWFFNNHTMFGQVYDADDNQNSRQSFTELRTHIQTEYGNIYTTGGVHESNTICLSDNGGKASTTYPVRDIWSRCLELKYSGETKARLSQSGYMQIQGSGSSGTLSGLIFKNTSGMSFTTAGSFKRASVSAYDSLWLSGNLSGNLVFKNGQGAPVIAGVANNGTVHLRGWETPQFPRF